MQRTSGILVLVAAIGACGGGSRTGGDAGPGGGSDAGPLDAALGPENTMATCFDGVDNDGDGDTDCIDAGCLRFPGCMPPTDAGPGTDAFMDCTGRTLVAENELAPVDIVWTVDSSNSMVNDLDSVQDNMDDFADFIVGEEIDFHIVLITSSSDVDVNPRFFSDPRFRFIDRSVGSQDVFIRTLDQFPMYSDFLREGALTHVVGVTDDDDDMSSGVFISMMQERLGHEFTFHAIAAEEAAFGLPCTPAGDLLPAAAVGDRYFDAADRTGGRSFNICTGDWSSLFTTLAETVAVSEALPCVYEIPEPPAGMALDYDEVNVEHTPEGGPTARFPRAADEAACGGASAWYYDDPATPTQIRLCPAACTAVTAGPGSVDVRLGCATLLI